MTDSTAPFILVDGSGFIFRAFFADSVASRGKSPIWVRPSDGLNVGAVALFSNMLHKLLSEYPDAPMVVCFDSSRKSFRTEMYPEYKAHRPPPPEELVPQFPLIRDAVRAFGLPAVELENYEADDLIASYTRAALAAGRTVEIVSGDKDLMQLIKPGVTFYDPMKGKLIGIVEVAEKFGVTPDKVGDVLALMGDSSDNVPGAPGIGPKTAAELITTYGDLETLLARAGEIKQPKRREAIINNAALIRLSRQLVALDEQTPLPLPLEQILPPQTDKAVLLGWLQQQGFKALVARMGGAMQQGAPTPPLPHPKQDEGGSTVAPSLALLRGGGLGWGQGTQPPFGPYACVDTLDQLKSWVTRASAAGIIAIDTETDSLTPSTTTLVGISLAVAVGEACYIPLHHRSEGLLSTGPLQQIPLAEAVAVLKPLLEDKSVLKIGQNMKFDWQVFAQHGIDVVPYDDTMLLSYVLDNGLHGHGMDELSEKFLGHKPIAFAEVCGSGKAMITFDQVPLDKATAYSAEDADVTLRLWHVFKPRLAAEKQVELYETIERPLVRTVAEMERAGVLIDAGILRKLSQDFAVRMNGFEAEIHALAGHPFNVGSPKQLGEVLFDQMQLTGGSKGKAGAWSTDADTLEDLAAQGHAIAEKVLSWRMFQKLRSTYTESLPQQIDPRTGRVHTAFSLAGTVTGRLSSSDPNLQNIPIRTEDGRSIRRAFVAAEGNVLISADYSQIELRLLAHVANIPALKQAFVDGVDIHAKTASEVFGVPLAEMTSELRRRAKAINFGIVYGISAFGLARQLSIPQGEAATFIRIYFERFPELKTYMDSMKDQCRQRGYVETLWGRKCHLPGITDKNPARRSFAERQAINAPLQGTAADIIKRAMNHMPSALSQSGLSARMLLQVHDELLFEVPAAEAAATARVVKSIMEGAAALSVPLIVEVGTGPSWAEAH